MPFFIEYFSKKLKLLTLVFMISGCSANDTLVEPIQLDFETTSFDVVQKRLVIDPDLPNYLETILVQWFDHRIKIDGFDGDMVFTVSDFSQNITPISDGKRVDISLSFKLIINKKSSSKTQQIKGNISSYGVLTGNFALKEFDSVIKNTQKDLILRLSKDLKSKN